MPQITAISTPRAAMAYNLLSTVQTPRPHPPPPPSRRSALSSRDATESRAAPGPIGMEEAYAELLAAAGLRLGAMCALHSARMGIACVPCSLHVHRATKMCTEGQHTHAHAHARCAILRREGRGALMRALLDAGVAVRQGHSRPRATLLDHLDQHVCYVQSPAARQARWRRAGGADGAEWPRLASPPFFPPGNEPCAASDSIRPCPARESPHSHVHAPLT